MPLFSVGKQGFTLYQVVKNRTQSGNIFPNISNETGEKNLNRQKPPTAGLPGGVFYRDAARAAKRPFGVKMDGWMTLGHQRILGKNAWALRQVARLSSSSEHSFTCATVSEISFT